LGGVLWSNERRDCKVALGKCGRQKESPQV
jgi:hypothetical protein